MARKRIRPRPTPAPERPEVPERVSIHRPDAPPHTANYWRNCYEAEHRTNALMYRHLMSEREENRRLKAEIERLTKPKARRVKRRLS